MSDMNDYMLYLCSPENLNSALKKYLFKQYILNIVLTLPFSFSYFVICTSSRLSEGLSNWMLFP